MRIAVNSSRAVHDAVQGQTDSNTFERGVKYDAPINHMMKYLPSIGVTSAFISCEAAPRKFIDRFLKESKKYLEGPVQPNHTKLLGLDLEGSFLKDPVFAGAQVPENYLKPSIELFEALQ